MALQPPLPNWQRDCLYHGEYAVIALPSILGAAGMKATDREFGLVSEQVVKILARVSRLLNHDAIVFDESAALKRINETKGA